MKPIYLTTQSFTIKVFFYMLIMIICGFVKFEKIELIQTGAKNWYSGKKNLLPYDDQNPVIYDNDYANDEVDWYLMAIASAGGLNYRGITTTSAVAPFVKGLPEKVFRQCIKDRTKIVEIGRRCGFRNVPDPVEGVIGNLIEPISGEIEDTKPIYSPGTLLILSEARKASVSEPLVVCMGGPLTVVADAYLLDPSIADKMVVAWTGGRYDSMNDYNGWVDPWAAYIALQRLRLVQFPVDPTLFPGVSKSWIRDNFPDNEAKKFLLPLTLDIINGDNLDGDGMPAVSVAVPGYVKAVKHVSFQGWEVHNGHKLPTIKDDPNGKTIVVTEVDSKLARNAYKKAFLNSAVWGKGK